MRQVRNKFEAAFQQLHPDLEYETIKLGYRIERNYIPDFICHETKTIFELKGRFENCDRQKMIAVRDAHPDWKIIIIFQNANRKINKGSKTTYAQWCDRHGIEWQEFKKH